ncbi:XRE family transcriptional regulator [Mycobacterium avium]|uniref:XRE family transcriptional regulator n=1 Tax=Mycobacterium avium TaxID=1764 RepID=UPI001156FC7B|nr:XRE family transcriptional regulator [Mycobacterium avium]
MRDLRDMWDIDDMTTAHAQPWVPDTSSFGSRLALLRHYMGWNLKEAALACGVPAASWREWELSDRRPRDLFEVCQKIGERTGCDDIWLMTGRVTPGAPTPPHGPKDRSSRGIRIIRPIVAQQVSEKDAA